MAEAGCLFTIFLVFITFSHLLCAQVNGNEAGEEGVTEISKGMNDKKCATLGGIYYRGIQCCKGKYIKTREELNYFGPQFKTCLRNTSKASENQDDHLPALLWKAYLCVLKSTSAFPDEINFQAYVNHMTSDYTPEIKKEVRAANTECVKADEEKEDWKRILRFAECFHQKEKAVCHQPTAEPKSKEEQRKEDRVSNIIAASDLYTCTPLEGSVTPLEGCCQKTPIPLSMTHLFDHAFVNLIAMSGFTSTNQPAFQKCSLSFKTQQNKLLKANGTASTFAGNTCLHACLFVPKPYDGPENLELNVTLMELNMYAMSLLPDSFPQKLEEAMKYNFHTKLFDTVDKNKMKTFSELIVEFKETKDEFWKINDYCGYYNLVTWLMELSFWQYCTDVEWMKKITAFNHF